MILLKNIINESTLSCLDISHVLYGPNPDEYNSINKNQKYCEKVDEIKKYLEKNKKKYIKALRDIRINKVDISRNKYLENDELIPNIIDKEKINVIISNENSKFQIFLKEKVKEFNIPPEKEEKLIDYLRLKRCEKDLEKLEQIKKSKKLIII